MESSLTGGRNAVKGTVYWPADAQAFDETFIRARRDDILVASEANWIREAFRRRLQSRNSGSSGRLPRLLVTTRLGPGERAAYEAFSDRVVDGGLVRFLPPDELHEAMTAPHRDELFVGAVYDPVAGIAILYKGTLEPIVIPGAWFLPLADAATLKKIRVIDYGQTVRAGRAEIATDAILYEFDSLYRRRAKARLRRQDGIGAGIRRLRLQRGLRQDDFSRISRREISRIETGEIATPKPETLRHIAATLGVDVSELASY